MVVFSAIARVGEVVTRFKFGAYKGFLNLLVLG